MTTATPSAPSTPAATAPAPAAAPSTPAWGGGDVGSLLAGVVSDSPAAAPAASPAAAAPTPAPAAAQPAPAAVTPEPSQPEGAPAQPPAQPAAAQPATPANPAPAAPAAAPKPEILLAGRFKAAIPEVDKDPGVVALVQAYDASGKEARRLVAVVEQAQGQVKNLETEKADLAKRVALFELEQQLGPEMKDPTPEELATWDAAKTAQFYVNKDKRERLKAQLETDRKVKAEKETATIKATQDQIMGRFQLMRSKPDEFPRHAELEPIMDELMKVEPGIIGKAQAPLLLYLAAYGHEALQRERASKTAERASEEEARKKAGASIPAAAGAGGAGAPPPEPAPSAPPGPAKGSDEEHIAKLLAAHSAGGKPILPID